MTDESVKNDAYWRDKLSPEQYQVCRQQGTEPAFSGEYWDCNEQGDYLCRCCGELLFHSSNKFDAHCGWPSFYQAAENAAVAEHQDASHGMIRTEVTCQSCGSHLGHIFPDGPAPTGLRYCINSLSIKLASGGKAAGE